MQSLPEEENGKKREKWRVEGRLEWKSSRRADWRITSNAGQWPSATSFRLSLSPSLSSYSIATTTTPTRLSTSTLLSTTRVYKTAPVQMWFADIISPLASKMSGGRWSSLQTSRLPSDVAKDRWNLLPEVTDDSQILLMFSSDVEIKFIRYYLKVYHHLQPLNYIPIEVGYCSNRPRNRCIQITLNEGVNLKENEVYRLELVRGSYYHSLSRELEDDITLSFTGKASFVFPLISPQKQNYLFKLRNSVLKIYSRHGIEFKITKEYHNGTLQAVEASYTTLVDLLQNSVHFTPALNFSLQIVNSNGRCSTTNYIGCWIEINGDFKPNAEYLINIESNSKLRDGLGLPLKSSFARYKTADVPSYALVSNSAFIDGAQPNINWTIFAQNVATAPSFDTITVTTTYTHKHSAVMTAITSSNLNEIVCSYHARSKNSWIVADSSITFNSTDEFVKYQFEDTEALLSTTGALYTEYWLGNKWNKNAAFRTVRFLFRLNFTATIIWSSKCEITVWVVSLVSNKPIEGAYVSIIRTKNYAFNIYDPLSLVKEKFQDKSNSDGTVTFNGCAQYRNDYDVVVKVDNKLLLIPSAQLGWETYAVKKVKIVSSTDRHIYAPGESILLFGYIKSIDENERPFKISNADIKSLHIQANFIFDKLPVTVQHDGSFNISLSLPHNTTFGKHNILIRAYGSSPEIRQVDIIVAKPIVLPTVILLAPQSPRYDVEDGVTLTINTNFARSGLPAPNTTFLLQWSIQRGASSHVVSLLNDAKKRDELQKLHSQNKGLSVISNKMTCNMIGWSALHATSLAHRAAGTECFRDMSGSANFVTNSSGLLLLHFQLPSYVNPLDGDIIKFNAAYFDVSSGNTRAASNEITSAVTSGHSNFLIDIQPTTFHPIPSTSFGVWVDLLEQSKSSFNSYHKRVNIGLYTWDGVSPKDKLVNKTTGDILIPESQRLHKCTVMADAYSVPHCSFELPSVGTFLLIATYTDKRAGYLISTAYPLGKTLAQWNKYPLRFQRPITVFTKEHEYQQGDVVTFTFFNPYSNLLSLTKFGNQDDKNQHVDFHSGTAVSNISVAIGKECAQGCAVIIIFSVKRDALWLTSKVPTSDLFDLSAPFSFRYSTAIKVQLSTAMLNSKIKAQHLKHSPTYTLSIKLQSSPNKATTGTASVIVLHKYWYSRGALLGSDFVSQFATSKATKPFGSLLQDITYGNGYTKLVDRISALKQKHKWYTPTFPITPVDALLSPVQLDTQSGVDYFEMQEKAEITEYSKIGLFKQPSSTQDGTDRDYDFNWQQHHHGESLSEEESYESSPSTAEQPAKKDSHFFSPAEPKDYSITTAFVQDNYCINNNNVSSTCVVPFAQFSIQVPLGGTEIDLDNLLEGSEYLVQVVAVSKENSFTFAQHELSTPVRLLAELQVPALVNIFDEFSGQLLINVNSKTAKRVHLEVEIVADNCNIIAPKLIKTTIDHGEEFKQFVQFTAVAIGVTNISIKVTERDTKNILYQSSKQIEVVSYIQPNFITYSLELTDARMHNLILPKLQHGDCFGLVTSSPYQHISFTHAISHILFEQGSLTSANCYDYSNQIVPLLAFSFYNNVNTKQVTDTFDVNNKEVAQRNALVRFKHTIEHIEELYLHNSNGLQFLSGSNQQAQFELDLSAYVLGLFRRIDILLDSEIFPVATAGRIEAGLEAGLFDALAVPCTANSNGAMCEDANCACFTDYDLLSKIYFALGTRWKLHKSRNNLYSIYHRLLSLDNLLHNGYDSLSNLGKVYFGLALVYDTQVNITVPQSNKIIEKVIGDLLKEVEEQANIAFVSNVKQQSTIVGADTITTSLFAELLIRCNTRHDLIEKLISYLTRKNSYYLNNSLYSAAGVITGAWSSTEFAAAAMTISLYDSSIQSRNVERAHSNGVRISTGSHQLYDFNFVPSDESSPTSAFAEFYHQANEIVMANSTKHVNLDSSACPPNYSLNVQNVGSESLHTTVHVKCNKIDTSQLTKANGLKVTKLIQVLKPTTSTYYSISIANETQLTKVEPETMVLVKILVQALVPVQNLLITDFSSAALVPVHGGSQFWTISSSSPVKWTTASNTVRIASAPKFSSFELSYFAKVTSFCGSYAIPHTEAKLVHNPSIYGNSVAWKLIVLCNNAKQQSVTNSTTCWPFSPLPLQAITQQIELPLIKLNTKHQVVNFSSSSNNVHTIVGLLSALVGALMIIAFLVLLIVVFVKRRRRRASEAEEIAIELEEM